MTGRATRVFGEAIWTLIGLLTVGVSIAFGRLMRLPS